MRYPICLWALSSALCACSDGRPPWRSDLYPEDWEPGFGVDDWALHDHAYAGYRSGEVGLPEHVEGPVISVLDHGADPTGDIDSTAAVQAAIDAVAEAGGGTVLLPAGEYRIDDLLSVTTSGTLIQGDGSDATYLWFTRSETMSYKAHITFDGSLGDGTEHLLVEDEANFSHTVRVGDASGLAPGDHVDLGWVVTDEWIEEHGMTGTWTLSAGQWRPFFRRQVEAVDLTVSPHLVTLDVPLRYDALVRDGASIREQSGYLEEVGVADLALSTVVDWADAWSVDNSHALLLSRVSDAWVRDLVSYASRNSDDDRDNHLLSGGIKVFQSKRVTIADVTLEKPQNRGSGGNGYLFEISQSSEILTRDSTAREGRHNFIQNWDFGTSGCVWLRVHSEGGRSMLGDWDPIGYPSYSEFHHSLAMANLIDSSTLDDGWKAANRHEYSSGAGLTATDTTFWNNGGSGLLHSWQSGPGYVIGTGPDLTVATSLSYVDPISRGPHGTAPEDWREGIGHADSLEPASLYLDQLSRH